MIKKLRRRFIAIAMLSSVAVIAVIMISLNLVNYYRMVGDADSTLQMIIDNGGQIDFEKREMPQGGPDGTKTALPPEEGSGADGGFFGDFMNPRYGMEETRFFTVTMSDNGTAVSVDTGRISSVSSSTAEEYGKEVFSSGKQKGFYNGYRFATSEKDGNKLIVFVDCQKRIADLRGVMLISAGVSAAGLLAIFILICILSAGAVKPISKNYENQKRFITDAGHEIKTPIAIINADAEVLESEIGENEWLDDISVQTKRLSDLTSDLITLAKAEEGPGSVPLLTLSLSGIFNEICESFKARALVDGKEYNYDCAGDITVKGDEKSLRQLLSIILDNAFKYSEKKVDASLAESGRFCTLTVKNDVPKEPDSEKVDNMFERFYRLDSSRSSETGGHGIGLSIAKAVTDLHKGRIKADYRDGKMIITVKLPK